MSRRESNNKRKIRMRSANVILAIAAVLCSQSVIGDEHKGDEDESGGPSVFVTNGTDAPVPVEVIPTHGDTVVCTRGTGSGGGSSPAGGGGGAGAPMSSVSCPVGIQKIDVHRIAFSPDLTNTVTTFRSWRVTVGVEVYVSGGPRDLNGILAIVTDGAPVTDVFQSFQLDTTDSIRSLYFYHSGSTLLDSQLQQHAGTLLFIGKPIP